MGTQENLHNVSQVFNVVAIFIKEAYSQVSLIVFPDVTDEVFVELVAQLTCQIMLSKPETC